MAKVSTLLLAAGAVVGVAGCGAPAPHEPVNNLTQATATRLEMGMTKAQVWRLIGDGACRKLTGVNNEYDYRCYGVRGGDLGLEFDGDELLQTSNKYNIAP